MLLLDEPLSALDAQTRAVVRGELQDLFAELELPTLLVTHDFRDAAALADRVGVLVDGRLRQLGTPDQLTAAPADSFVARFTGANVLLGEAVPDGAGGATVALDERWVDRRRAARRAAAWGWRSIRGRSRSPTQRRPTRGSTRSRERSRASRPKPGGCAYGSARSTSTRAP